MGGRRAWLIWGSGMLAYLVAVFHRSSLGVAGVQAAERFGVGATLLATFSVAQLAVYAAMQVPVGVLLDRFGSRRLLAVGAAAMAVGQFVFAVAGDVRLAIAARVLIGLGDAMTFISVLRVAAVWFAPRRYPLMVQLTAVGGQLGALASATPLVVLLHRSGWTPTFLIAAGLGAGAAVLVATTLRDSPADVRIRRARVWRARPWRFPAGRGPEAAAGPGDGPAAASVARQPAGEVTAPARRSLGAVRGDLSMAWREPGTRLGFWTHFTTQFSGSAFALIWGYPFLVAGQGLAPRTAALLLSVLIVVGLGAGPLVGFLCGRLPQHRSRLVLAIVGASAVAWAAVLLWPGRAPMWLLVLLVTVLAANGPGSMIGFDYARSFNPAARLGSATGIVNVGGFIAAITLIISVGMVLDRMRPASGGGYPLAAFRWAFALQYLLWGLGVVQVIRYRNVTRRRLAQRDPQARVALRGGPATATA